MTRGIRVLCALMLSLAAAGCGFRPIYATPADGSAAALNQRVAVRSVVAPDTVQPLIVSALNDRIVLKEGETPKYGLDISATESAERLAVQIDATVTRYNYRLQARYTLVDLETGESTRGAAQAVTSYNIVSSQYSTLFAERTAQEKAAAMLAEEIERDLLIRFSDRGESDFDAAPIGIDAETEILIEPGSGEPIDARRDE